MTGEYKGLIQFFTEEKYLGENGTEGSFSGFITMLFISCTLVIILNSSFFMSNEKNSSLFTQLLANTKDLFTCILSRFILAGNKFTLHIVLGLTISTVGAMMFSMKSIFDNMISGNFGKKKEEVQGVVQEISIEQDSTDSTPEQKVEIKN